MLRKTPISFNTQYYPGKCLHHINSFHSRQQCLRVPISPHLTSTWCCLLVIGIPVSLCWYLIVVLICISLMDCELISDLYVFMAKYIIRSLIYFLARLLVLIIAKL